MRNNYLTIFLLTLSALVYSSDRLSLIPIKESKGIESLVQYIQGSLSEESLEHILCRKNLPFELCAVGLSVQRAYECNVKSCEPVHGIYYGRRPFSN